MAKCECKCDRNTFTGKIAWVVLHIICWFMCLMFLVSAGFRFARFGKTEPDPFFYIYSIYLVIFVIVLFVADISWLHVKLWKILYLFTFLHQWVGWGSFVIFIGLLLLDWHHAFEFITALVSLIIGIAFIVYGCFFDWWTNPNPVVGGPEVAKDVKAKEEDWSSKYKMNNEEKKSAL